MMDPKIQNLFIYSFMGSKVLPDKKYGREKKKEQSYSSSHKCHYHTVCPRSLGPCYIVTCNIIRLKKMLIIQEYLKEKNTVYEFTIKTMLIPLVFSVDWRWAEAGPPPQSVSSHLQPAGTLLEGKH